ncbi:MAG: hydrogenase-4 component G [Halarcobacter sp.]
MGTLDISMINNQYLNNDNNITSDQMKPYGLSKTEKSDETKAVENKIHNSAVNVSISMESIKVFLNIKSVEMTQNNTNAQTTLMNIINNTDLYDFLSGKELDGGLSLSSIGYNGKPITELNPDEAKQLVSDEGFFGIDKTSQRVSDFVISLAGDDVEALQEARNGIVQGFNEAEKMWGGELPEISYKTQEKTLDIIDKKIAELLKTDSQKEIEDTEKAQTE